MEVRLQSGKLILVEADRLGEIWKLRGFLTEDEMAQLEENLQKDLQKIKKI